MVDVKRTSSEQHHSISSSCSWLRLSSYCDGFSRCAINRLNGKPVDIYSAGVFPIEVSRQFAFRQELASKARCELIFHILYYDIARLLAATTKLAIL